MHMPNRLLSAPANFDRCECVVPHDIERGISPASPFPALEATREGSFRPTSHIEVQSM
jgi:hypothetical protein